MFVEVTRRSNNKSFMVNTDHVRAIDWKKEDGRVTGVLTYSNGDRVTVDLGPANDGDLFEALRNLSGVSIQHDTLG